MWPTIERLVSYTQKAKVRRVSHRTEPHTSSIPPHGPKPNCKEQRTHPQCLQSPSRTETPPGSCLWLSPAWLQISCSCWQTTPAAACSLAIHVPAPSRKTIRESAAHGTMGDVHLHSQGVKRLPPCLWSETCLSPALASSTKFSHLEKQGTDMKEIARQYFISIYSRFSAMVDVRFVVRVPFSSPLLSAPCTRRM